MRRIEKLQVKLREAGMDTAVLMPGPNLLYFSGIHAHASERPLLLFVPAEGEPAIVCPFLEAPKAEQAGLAAGRVFAWRDGEGFAGAFAQVSEQLGLAGQTIAAEKLYMRLLELETLQGVAANLTIAHLDPIANGLRLVKDADEISRMIRATAVAEEAMQWVLPRIQTGQTEKHVAMMLTQALGDAGSEGVPFGPIVSSGPNAASPHAVPTTRPLVAGDLVVIDWGAIVEDYPSDITRTYAVGEVSAAHRHIYETVRRANEAGKAACRPQNSCGDVDDAARKVIDDEGFGDYFIHRTGHGLGLEVHEEPSIVGGNEMVLREGMTFTVEPGIYVPNEVGVRIEDDVLITAEGHRSLSSLTRELVMIG